MHAVVYVRARAAPIDLGGGLFVTGCSTGRRVREISQQAQRGGGRGATAGTKFNTKITKINTGTVRKFQRELHPPVERLRAERRGVEELLGGMPVSGGAEAEPRRVGGSAP